MKPIMIDNVRLVRGLNRGAEEVSAIAKRFYEAFKLMREEENKIIKTLDTSKKRMLR